MDKRIAGFLVVMCLMGCTKAAPVAPREPLVPAAGQEAPRHAKADKAKAREADRSIAFTARSGKSVSLCLWDAKLQEVLVLSGALARLDVSGVHDLYPYVYENGKKVYFTIGDRAFSWDLEKEERTTPVTDGRPPMLGGPSLVITSDGKWLAYIRVDGLVVFRRNDGPYIAQPAILTKIAAEVTSLRQTGNPHAAVQSLSLTDDASLMALSIAGCLYFYDLVKTRLYQVAPFDGTSLAGAGQGLELVELSPKGRYVACILHGGRILVLDTWTRTADTLPYPNMAGRTANVCFLSEHELLVTSEGGEMGPFWIYDVRTELLRPLVILNNALGELGSDVAVSDPGL